MAYVEEQWRPTGDLHHLFGNFEQCGSELRKINQFMTDALAILRFKPKMGRSINSGYYPERELFLADARKAYKEIKDLDLRPSQPLLAIYMGISYSCFKHYKKEHKLVWPGELI
jgi:hypothetical protein